VKKSLNSDDDYPFEFRVLQHSARLLEHTCYFFVNAWLSNFCHGFSNFLGIFSSKMESLQTLQEVLGIEE